MVPEAAVFQREEGGCRVILLGQVFGQFAGEENPIGLVFTGNPVQEVFKPRN